MAIGTVPHSVPSSVARELLCECNGLSVSPPPPAEGRRRTGCSTSFQQSEATSDQEGHTDNGR